MKINPSQHFLILPFCTQFVRNLLFAVFGKKFVAYWHSMHFVSSVLRKAKIKRVKREVINDPLGQPTVPGSEDQFCFGRFWKVKRTYRRTYGRTEWVNIVITTGQDCGRPRGSKEGIDSFPSLRSGRTVGFNSKRFKWKQNATKQRICRNFVHDIFIIFQNIYAVYKITFMK